MRTVLLVLLYSFQIALAFQKKGILLENLTWIEAEKVLTKETIVVLPIGAASKEHGPHLKLKNDLILAEYFKARVIDASNVVVAPTIPYHFYPAFVEYPGSTTLRLETARDVLIVTLQSDLDRAVGIESLHDSRETEGRQRSSSSLTSGLRRRSSDTIE